MKRNVLYTKARCGLDDNCWRLKNHDGECTRKMEPSGAAYKLAEQLEESDAESVTIYLDKDGDPFFTSILMPMIVTDAFRERGEPESA